MVQTMRKYGRGRRLVTLAVQDLHIRRQFPGFSSILRNGRAVWRGKLQPTEVSPVYTVEVRYQLEATPKVRVLSPVLPENAPHLYGDGSLCLYWPEEWRWQQDVILADTILPWTALWLYYYELWLDTGEWLAPSSPHRGSKPVDRADKE